MSTAGLIAAVLCTALLVIVATMSAVAYAAMRSKGRKA